MKPANLLVLMSDEHNPKIMGASGHRIVKTPHLDALAARGTLFSSAYTTCPVCVPARAAFATGKYVHQIGFWDNADAYDGSVPSWHHRLRARGHRVVSIGKPLVAPAEFYYRYPLSEMPLPKQYGRAERPEHPCLRDYAESFVYDRFFDEETVRKAMAAYYALCTFLDDNIYLP